MTYSRAGPRIPAYLLKASRASGARRATSALRVLPSYVVLGTQRGGTSSLHRYLSQHPAIMQALPKEVHYFDRNYDRGAGWYRSHFPTSIAVAVVERRTGVRPAVGETTPGYLFHPRAPQRVVQLLPNAKFIILLRNPVDRAYSSYWHRVAQGHEELPTFEDALQAEGHRLDGELERMVESADYNSENRRLFSYVTRGLYAEQLERWLAYFPRDRFLIERSESLFEDPAAVIRRICVFLGLPEWSPGSFKPFNALASGRIDPSTRAHLVDYFKPHNQRLHDLLGRDLGWDE
jgi:hypothetical protein